MMTQEDLISKAGALSMAFRECHASEEKREVVEDVLQVFEAALATGPELRVLVYYNACGWLSQSDMIWEWVIQRAAQADQSELCVMNTAIFELLAEEPTDAFWRDRLLSLLQRRELWKVVVEAYRESPAKLFADLRDSCEEPAGEAEGAAHLAAG